MTEPFIRTAHPQWGREVAQSAMEALERRLKQGPASEDELLAVIHAGARQSDKYAQTKGRAADARATLQTLSSIGCIAPCEGGLGFSEAVRARLNRQQGIAQAFSPDFAQRAFGARELLNALGPKSQLLEKELRGAILEGLRDSGASDLPTSAARYVCWPSSLGWMESGDGTARRLSARGREMLQLVRGPVSPRPLKAATLARADAFVPGGALLATEQGGLTQWIIAGLAADRFELVQTELTPLLAEILVDADSEDVECAADIMAEHGTSRRLADALYVWAMDIAEDKEDKQAIAISRAQLAGKPWLQP